MTNEPATTTLHVLLNGDSRVGKSLLIQCHADVDSDCRLVPWSQQVPGLTLTSAYDTAIAMKEINGRQYRVIYTIDPEIRYRSIHVRTHIDLICFSLVDLESYENVRTKWYPELREVNQDAVVFLVGTKADLREANMNDTRQDFSQGGTDMITDEQVSAMKREIGAELYFESPSCMTEEMFNRAVEVAIRVAHERKEAADRSKRSSSCIVT